MSKQLGIQDFLRDVFAGVVSPQLTGASLERFFVKFLTEKIDDPSFVTQMMEVPSNTLAFLEYLDWPPATIPEKDIIHRKELVCKFLSLPNIMSEFMHEANLGHVALDLVQEQQDEDIYCILSAKNSFSSILFYYRFRSQLEEIIGRLDSHFVRSLQKNTEVAEALKRYNFPPLCLY
jgi:hypothetical protein